MFEQDLERVENMNRYVKGTEHHVYATTHLQYPREANIDQDIRHNLLPDHHHPHHISFQKHTLHDIRLQARDALDTGFRRHGGSQLVRHVGIIGQHSEVQEVFKR